MFLSDFLFRVLFQVASCFLAASLLQGLLKAEPQGQIRAVRKTKNHFHSQCQGGKCVRTAARIRQSICCTSFRRKNFRTFRRISAKFPQNVRNLRWRSRNDFGQFSAKISAKFPQLLEVQFAVRGGGDRVKLSVW